MSKYDSASYQSYKEKEMNKITPNNNIVPQQNFIFNKEEFLDYFRTLNLDEIVTILHFNEKEKNFLKFIVNESEMKNKNKIILENENEKEKVNTINFNNKPHPDFSELLIEDFISKFENFKNIRNIKNELIEKKENLPNSIINLQPIQPNPFNINSQDSQLEMFIDYINYFYGEILTPATMKNIFEYFLQNSKGEKDSSYLIISEEDVKRLVYNKFKRYQVNLTEEREKFKQFLIELS